MAAKKSTKTKSIPERIEEIQVAASKQVREAIDFLGSEPRKVVGDLRSEFDKASKKLGHSAEKAVKELRSDIDKRRKDLTKRAEKAVKDARKQAETFAADVRKQVEHAVEPVTTRLDVASRADVDRLRKRLDQLEKRMGQLAAPASAGNAPKDAVIQ